MAEYDDIVVGQGLAGTLLAFALEARGRRVLVADDARRGAATPAAAGLINPVTGMRLTVTEGAAVFIPEAIATFRALEQRLGARFFSPLDLYRAYENEAERALKARRVADPESARWYGPDLPPGGAHPALADPLGGFMILGGGWVDLPVLSAAARDYFARSGRLETTTLEHAAVRPEVGGVRWGGHTARRMIFCEGAAVRSNPWFGHLAWQPAKGEFVTCEAAGTAGVGFAIKHGVQAIPLGGDRWRVGSNYEWQKLDDEPTPAVRDSLVLGFQKLFRVRPAACVVTEHRTGIRPAAKGAKPIVGTHPDHPALVVFNGFGAKGCTWIPHYARLFAEASR